MKLLSSLLLAVALLLASSAHAFAPSSVGQRLGSATASSFATQQQLRVVGAAAVQPSRSGRSQLYMGSMAKFGVFSPAVYVAKVVLGSDKLNKVRGKAISLHSEKIGEFCQWVGAYHLRTKLIKKAKTNGDILGFLV